MADIASLGIVVKTTGAKEATRDLKALDAQADKSEKSAAKLGKAWGAALGAGAAGLIVGGVTAIVKATIEADRVQGKLESRVKALGAASAASVVHINKMADSLQAASTFDDEGIKEAATALLSFTNIRGDNFDRTLQSVLDLAEATGTDLPQAAEKLGKALNSPATAARQLRDLGIELSKTQKALVKDMLATGRGSEAQAFLLGELEKRYAGAAAAARNTLGGALKGLKNDFSNLLEGDGNGVKGATSAINDLAETMRSPGVKQGFQSIVNGLFDVINMIAKAIPKIVAFNDQINQSFGLAGNGQGQRKGNALDFFDAQGARFDALLKRDSEAFKAASKRAQAGFSGGIVADFSGVTSRSIKSSADFSGVTARTIGVGDDSFDGRGFEGGGASKKKKNGPSAESIQNARDRFDDFVGRFKSEVDGPLKKAEEDHIQRQRELQQVAAKGKVSASELAEALKLEGEAYAKATDEIKASFDAQASALSGPLAAAEGQHKANLREIDLLAKEAGLSSEQVAKMKAEEARSYDEATQAAKRQQDPMQALLDDMQFEMKLLGMTNAARATAIQQRDLEAQGIKVNTEELLKQNKALEEAQLQANFMQDLKLDLADTFTDFITGAKSAKEAFGDFADSLFKRAVQLMADKAVNALFSAFTGGAGAGGASAGGFADLFASAAGGFGFADGGFTGPGSRNELAGIVHKGEYVLNANATRALGVGNLDRLNSGARLDAGSGAVTVYQNFSSPGRIDQNTASQMQQDAARKLRIATDRNK